ncbi:transglutaminase domain-containing protein [Aquimarina mytili]|uniref:Transglutaminase-like domain-containing protein n=1 Tax=Aquimarina mytili TaxID=874423 RepID=A0A936ZUD4_9FLAO|nr:transglutaminase domain-containing protein [Aquimarina mytili]MBL0682185.1 hypothetical protein [Aquimarina mytili]
MRIFIQINIYLLLIACFSNCLHAQVSDFKSTDFTRADNIARLYKDAPINNLPVLAYQLTHDLPTQVEKFRAIYIWVCNNIKGDNAQHNTVSRTRKKLKKDSLALLKWNNVYKKIAFKKLLKHKKTMCTGYAYLIKELCYLANIESVIVDGYGRSVDANVKELEIANHSWNAVRLNNKWYLCDATWSSGYMDQSNVFIKEYNNGYFLTDPVLFGKNHFPLEQKWALQEKLTPDVFVTAPLVYGKAFKHKIQPLRPQKMNTVIHKQDEVTFSFKTTRKIEDKNISLIHYFASKERTLDIYNVQNEDGIISFNYRFKNKGIYDTHLKINDDIVATYTVTVTKNEKRSRS